MINPGKSEMMTEAWSWNQLAEHALDEPDRLMGLQVLKQIFDFSESMSPK